MSDDQKTANAVELDKRQKLADEDNATRTGVGTRKRVGQTRGKNPMVIEWEAFDESKPETLPKGVPEFIKVTGVKGEEALTQFLITGYNYSAYEAASDPLAEYVENVWSAETQGQFRIVVRNYARGLSVPLEEAVALIKPGFVKSFGSDKPVAA